ncbi:hypothetical protein PR202_ga29297 [Eleusine coracana subsp. coracana]|uniref:Disease resistance N-terminal domain-containing protein n=1 Tax=Eleusine coracana subsp. coracana TaxID=191504 RepID=A0AAV5DJK5_ELECO|nr:hypothetical protein PR202_ga29297 [Eleusine coracana subsp. coracana]
MERAVVSAAEGAVHALLGKLGTILVQEAQLFGGLRGQLQYLKDELESMTAFLQDLAERGEHRKQVKCCPPPQPASRPAARLSSSAVANHEDNELVASGAHAWPRARCRPSPLSDVVDLGCPPASVHDTLGLGLRRWHQRPLIGFLLHHIDANPVSSDVLDFLQQWHA